MLDFWHPMFHDFYSIAQQNNSSNTALSNSIHHHRRSCPYTHTHTQSHNKQTCGSVFKGIPCIDPVYQRLNNGAERERDKACLYCFLSFVSVHGTTDCVLSNNSDTLWLLMQTSEITNLEYLVALSLVRDNLW